MPWIRVLDFVVLTFCKKIKSNKECGLKDEWVFQGG